MSMEFLWDIFCVISISKHFGGGRYGKYPGIPSQTYSGISDKYGNNAVAYDLDKMVNPPKILVYLPGTNSKVQGAINFLESAVSSGYLVVGLAYANGPKAMGNTAVNPMDIECYWDSVVPSFKEFSIHIRP